MELEPASVSLRRRLAEAQQMLGMTQEALDNYAVTLRLNPRERERLTTSPGSVPRIRWNNSATGPRRSIFSNRSAAASDCDSNLLDTLAAAYAEAGRYDDALRTAETAIDRVRGENQSPESIADMQRRIVLYKKKQPYRDQKLMGPSSPSPPTAAGPEQHN